MSQQSIWLEGENFLKNTDPRLALLVDKYGHCNLTPVAPEQYYSTLVKGIISQQVANDVSQAFFKAFTDTYSLTPAPEKILVAPLAELTSCGFSLQKAGYIKELSQAIIDKKVTLEDFPNMPDSTIIRQLSQVKGFGRWTAEIFLILALNRPDVLPADDFGLKKAITLLCNLPSVPQKRSQINTLAEGWRPWRSLATWYLWQSFAETK